MIDRDRIAKYFEEINEQLTLIREILKEKNIVNDKLSMNAIKYSVIHIAEYLGYTLQHILAKKFHEAAEDYSTLIDKALQHGLISSELNGFNCNTI